MIFLLVGESMILALLDRPGIERWLYLVPCVTFILGCYYVLNFRANRQSRYKGMAVSRVMQSGSAGAVQLIAGFSKFGLSGLIVGQLLGQFFSVLFSVITLRQEGRRLLRRVSMKRMICVARKYISYPKLVIPGQFMNVGASELPLLLGHGILWACGGRVYSLAQRVMTAPLSLFANAIGDVYRQGAAEQYVARGQCLEIFIFSFKRLFFFAFLPMIPVLLFGPKNFSFMFDDNWRAAGEIVSVVSVLMFFQTIALPLSNTVLLRGWLLVNSVWQLLRVLSGGYFMLVTLWVSTTRWRLFRMSVSSQCFI